MTTLIPLLYLSLQSCLSIKMNKPLHFAPLVVWQQGRVGLGAGPAAQSKQRVRVGAVECWGRAAAGDTVCRAGLDRMTSVRSSGDVTSYPEISVCLADMVRYD